MKKNYLLVLLLGILNCAWAQDNPFKVTSFESTKEAKDKVAKIFGNLSDVNCISNIKIIGSPAAIGVFENGETIGINNGIVITTGNAAMASGPNKGNQNASMNHDLPGDPILTELLKQNGAKAEHSNTYDALSLEFDMIAQTDEITFNVVFGSEEYHEYINNYNDIFGIFVSGPGLSRGILGHQNIAKIPGYEKYEFINVQSVNCGYTAGFNTSPSGNEGENCDLLIDNNSNKGDKYTEYDAYTVVIPCSFKPVKGEVYHIKLAIADVKDKVLDSGVFFEIDEKSFIKSDNTDGIKIESSDNSNTTLNLVKTYLDEITEEDCISNITLTGAPEAIGTFSNAIDLGIEEGICLSTGKVKDIMGGNSESATSYHHKLEGDKLIDGMLKDEGIKQKSYDAAILEFDVVAKREQMKFNVIFGSEEYNEYVGYPHNDMFGIFVSEVESSREVQVNKNIATLNQRSNSKVINVNSINCGSEREFLKEPPGAEGTNCDLFVFNSTFENAAYPEFDGYTKPIECSFDAEIGEKYHVKVVISDVGDGMLDSGLFLSLDKESFSKDPFEGKFVVTSSSEKDEVTKLVEKYLNKIAGSDKYISNVAISGVPEASGVFRNGEKMGINKGLALSTGNAVDMMGPNIKTNTSKVNNSSGDEQLDEFMGGNNIENKSYDAAIIEFDMVAPNNEVKFNVVFGSEEYNEYVDSPFNDVFAIFVSELDASGKVQNTRNIASLNRRDTPNRYINVSTINCGVERVFLKEPSGEDGKNCGLYVFNDKIDDFGYPEFDGFTKPLPCGFKSKKDQKYHIKIVIADVRDRYIDSGILFEIDKDTFTIKDDEGDEPTEAFKVNGMMDINKFKNLIPQSFNKNLNKDNISNIKITGNIRAFGTFENGDAMGISNGICLSTGNVKDMEGPNTGGKRASSSLNISGDHFLDYEFNAQNHPERATHDAASIEFDIIATSNKLTFNTVFGSEEYSEYIRDYNDVFAIYVAGPGIEKGIGNSQNIAKIDGMPISTGTINCGYASGFLKEPDGKGRNCDLFVFNPHISDKRYPEFDGYTKPLSLSVETMPEKVYHIKIVIADVKDFVVDSGILLNIDDESFEDKKDKDEDIETSTNDDNIDTFTVYPNPAKSTVMVKQSSKFRGDKLILLDIMGNKLLEENIFGKNDVVLPLNELNAGIYNIIVVDSKGISHSKKLQVVK